jgi:hypothetical protein
MIVDVRPLWYPVVRYRFVPPTRIGRIAVGLGPPSRPDSASTRRLGLPALIACGVNTLGNVLSMVPAPDSVLFAAGYMYPLANQAEWTGRRSGGVG